MNILNKQEKKMHKYCMYFKLTTCNNWSFNSLSIAIELQNEITIKINNTLNNNMIDNKLNAEIESYTGNCSIVNEFCINLYHI